MISLYEWLAVAGVILGAGVAFLLKKLTLAGAVTGVVIALCMFGGGGTTSLAMLGLFFVSGTWATKFRYKFKKGLDLSEDNEGIRNASQVVANGGVAAVAGIAAIIFPDQKPIMVMMMAAALAAATSDTFSSEFGNVYGKRFINIVSLKSDSRGLNGVVSFEGTLFGLLGSALIAAVYATSLGWNRVVFFTFIAGMLGNVADSYLGALLERKNLLGNNQVNFLNTAIGSGTAYFLYVCFV